MKKVLVLLMLVPLAMVCSCQKQDATAEQQLAQRKAELDAREKALDQREKALTESAKAIARAALPAGVRLPAPKTDGASDAQPSAAIPPDLSPPDNSQLQVGREKKMDELRAVRQSRLEAIQKMRAMAARARSEARSAAAAPPPTTSAPADNGASASASGKATSSSPSPTPQ
jgi:hypothetical protein